MRQEGPARVGSWVGRLVERVRRVGTRPRVRHAGLTQAGRAGRRSMHAVMGGRNRGASALEPRGNRGTWRNSSRLGSAPKARAPSHNGCRQRCTRTRLAATRRTRGGRSSVHGMTPGLGPNPSYALGCSSRQGAPDDPRVEHLASRACIMRFAPPAPRGKQDRRGADGVYRRTDLTMALLGFVNASLARTPREVTRRGLATRMSGSCTVRAQPESIDVTTRWGFESSCPVAAADRTRDGVITSGLSTDGLSMLHSSIHYARRAGGRHLLPVWERAARRGAAREQPTRRRVCVPALGGPALAVQHADTVAGTPVGHAHVGFFSRRSGAASAMGTPQHSGSDQQGAGEGRRGGERCEARIMGDRESRWGGRRELARLVHRPTGGRAIPSRFSHSSALPPAWGVPCLLQVSVPPVERHRAFVARARGQLPHGLPAYESAIPLGLWD